MPLQTHRSHSVCLSAATVRNIQPGALANQHLHLHILLEETAENHLSQRRRTSAEIIMKIWRRANPSRITFHLFMCVCVCV